MPRPTAQKTAKTTAAPARPHEVRIIGGQWKRTKLPVADKPGLRPTPDRVRETLFNWLGQDLTGWRCLDMFAGTGALGLEAASRGAAEVHLFETDAALVAQLQQLGEGPVVPRLDWRAQERQARRLMADWRGLLERNVVEGRQVLGTLLQGPIVFTPILEETRRGVTFEGALAIGEKLFGNVDTTRLASPVRLERTAFRLGGGRSIH